MESILWSCFENIQRNFTKDFFSWILVKKNNYGIVFSVHFTIYMNDEYCHIWTDIDNANYLSGLTKKLKNRKISRKIFVLFTFKTRVALDDFYIMYY